MTIPIPPHPHRRPPVKAALLNHLGVLEFVEVDGTRDGIAAAIGAVGPSDLTARATWRCRAGQILTLWTSKSARQSDRNDLAARLVDELVPRPVDGVRDRIREDLAAAPPLGHALVTGYRPADETTGEPGQNTSLWDGVTDLVHSACDGRRARREFHRVQLAPDAATVAFAFTDPDAATVPLELPQPTTTILLAPADVPGAPNLLTPAPAPRRWSPRRRRTLAGTR